MNGKKSEIIGIEKYFMNPLDITTVVYDNLEKLNDSSIDLFRILQ